MAKLVPIDPPDEYGERLVFEALTGLTDDFVVLHGVRAITANRDRHETDILVMHPEHGFLFIEVKGGLVTLGDPGRPKVKWTGLRHDTGAAYELKNPFHQVLGNRRVMLDAFRQSCGSVCRGYYRAEVAVVLPGTPRPDDAEAVLKDEKDFCFFADDLEQLPEIVTRLLSSPLPPSARPVDQPGAACIGAIIQAFGWSHGGSAIHGGGERANVPPAPSRPPEAGYERKSRPDRVGGAGLTIALLVLVVFLGIGGLLGPGLVFVPLVALITVVAAVVRRWGTAALGAVLTVLGAVLSPSILTLLGAAGFALTMGVGGLVGGVGNLVGDLAGHSGAGDHHPVAGEVPAAISPAARAAPKGEEVQGASNEVSSTGVASKPAFEAETVPPPLPPAPPGRSGGGSPRNGGAPAVLYRPEVLGTDTGLDATVFAYIPDGGEREEWCRLPLPIVAVLAGSREVPFDERTVFETAAALAGFECPGARTLQLQIQGTVPETRQPARLASVAATATWIGEGDWRIEMSRDK